MQNKVRIVVHSNRDCHVDKAVTIAYPCSYEFGNKIRLIDSFGTYREVGGIEAKNYTPLILNFSKTQMWTEYVYEENEKELSFDETDKNIKKIVELFWGKNPICLKNGKGHTVGQSSDHFDLIDHNLKTINSVNSFNDKLRAAIKLKEMSVAERVDVSFFYGRNPVGKSDEDIMVDLADLNTGFCMDEKNLSNFLKVWVDNKTEDRDLLVNVKKAIALEIIDEKKNEGRTSYFLGESFMGSDDTGIIDWVRKNPRDYNEHIVRKVKESEKKEEKVITSAKVSSIQKVDLAEFEALKKKAAALIEEGFILPTANTQNMGYEKLKKAVDVAEAAKNNVVV